MHHDSQSSPATTSSDVQAVSEAGFESEGLAAQPVYDFPVHDDFQKNPTLTRTRVATLQRTIGNQATGRVIQRELARRKSEIIIQRATVTDEEETAIETGAASAKGFWSDQEKEKEKIDSAQGVPSLNFSKVTLVDFKKKIPLQKTVFELAGKTVDYQKSKAAAILGGNGIKDARVSALKKRDDFTEFVAGVIQKCEQKPYATLGEMDDMARGRFEVTNEADALKVFKALEPDAVSFTLPRTNKQGVTFYPRYHVIMRNPTGMTFEWQVGTKSTTYAYEEKGIKIPSALKEAAEAAGKHIKDTADLHDIDYAVFGKMLSSKDPEIAAAAQQYKLEPFHAKAALLLQKTGKDGEVNPELQAEVAELLGEASQLLEDLIAGGKTDMMVPFLH